MFIRLGAAVSVKIQNLQLRGNIYQFSLRVPQHLLNNYGKQFIRFSLGTSDLAVATRKAEEATRKYLSEFKVLTDGTKVTPESVATAGRMLAEQYKGDAEIFDLVVAHPALTRYVGATANLTDESPPVS
jgi:hypothetical protein